MIWTYTFISGQILLRKRENTSAYEGHRRSQEVYAITLTANTLLRSRQKQKKTTTRNSPNCAKTMHLFTESLNTDHTNITIRNTIKLLIVI